MNKRLKSVLYMGSYEEDYARNSMFIKGLQSNNIKVHQYNIKFNNIIRNILLFVKNFKNLYSKDIDMIILHTQVPIQFLFAKILAYLKKVPLIHDKFISKLQTIYYDRKLYARTKLLPKIIWYIILYSLDLVECKFADYILLDTYSHIKYFHEKFKSPLKKYKRFLIGAQDDIFYPFHNDTEESNKFIIGFWGNFIPLQGVKYILEAAKTLEKEIDIKFVLIGDGQEFPESLNLAKKINLKNVEFKGRVPLEELPKLISQFDIGLGIFGDTDKTTQVIPNKVFEGIAMNLPMISCDSPAIKELFTNNENIVLCERANSKSLANAILTLKNDEVLRRKVKNNAMIIFQKYCSTEAISKNLINYLNNILIRK